MEKTEMACLVDDPAVCRRSSVVLEHHLAALARTYDYVSRPIWVYDLSARCVYRNPSARRVPLDPASRLSFEITDHTGRLMGHLTTAEC